MLRKLLLICVTLWLLVPLASAADVLYESATPGPPVPNASGSLALLGGEFLIGVRFSLAAPAQIDRVGAHLITNETFQPNVAFLAIVPLELDGFPIDGTGSNPPNLASVALAHALLPFPTGPSADVFGDVDVMLPAGDYAFVVGTDMFSSFGSGVIPANNFDVVPDPSIFRWGSWDTSWLDLPNEGLRFVLEGTLVAPPTVPALGREGVVALFGSLLVLGSGVAARNRRLPAPPS